MRIDGTKARRFREAKKLTAAHIAIALDMSTSWVQKVERQASAKVNEPTAKTLARHLGVKLEEIVAVDDNSKQTEAQ